MIRSTNSLWQPSQIWLPTGLDSSKAPKGSWFSIFRVKIIKGLNKSSIFGQQKHKGYSLATIYQTIGSAFKKRAHTTASLGSDTKQLKPPYLKIYASRSPSCMPFLRECNEKLCKKRKPIPCQGLQTGRLSFIHTSITSAPHWNHRSIHAVSAYHISCQEAADERGAEWVNTDPVWRHTQYRSNPISERRCAHYSTTNVIHWWIDCKSTCLRMEQMCISCLHLLSELCVH